MQVGLGYIRLGQPAPTLSGGESQRVKLATELQRRSTGKTVYILDEPTTGLHFEDVRKLLLVLQGLVDKGNAVIVIEHNLDVVKSADWIIDLGPEGGDGGGTIVTQGTPEQVAQCEASWTGKSSRTCCDERYRSGIHPKCGESGRFAAREANASDAVAKVNRNGAPLLGDTRDLFRPKTGDIPAQPGVYKWRDGEGRVIYVGKAKKLKNRVSQYFQDTAAHNAKTRKMVSNCRSFRDDRRRDGV